MPQGFFLLLHRLRVLIAETWEAVATHEYGGDTMFLEMLQYTFSILYFFVFVFHCRTQHKLTPVGVAPLRCNV